MHFPIHIELRRSRLLAAVTVFLHVLAAGCVLVLPWPPAAHSLTYLLLPLFAVSGWYALRSSRFVGLRVLGSGELDCLLASGDRVPVSIEPDTTVFSQLIVLRVRDQDTGSSDSLVLLPDSMSVAEFRLLRLWLRWRSDPSGRVGGGV